MSKTPFSKPDVNDVANSSHVFKIRSSLNHWPRGGLPKARGKLLFGMVVALLMLGLQLTACGNTPPSTTSSASPTSNSTSQPNTPSTTSTPGSTSTAGSATGPTTGPATRPTTGPTTRPTTGPTTGPTEVPTADPSSFTVTVKGGTFCYSGTAGQSDVKITDFPSPLNLVYDGSANPAPGPINWTVSALQQEGASCSDSSTCTNL